MAVTINQASSPKRLEENSSRLLRQFQRQAALQERLTQGRAELLSVNSDDGGAVILAESDGQRELTDLLVEMEQSVQRERL